MGKTASKSFLGGLSDPLVRTKVVQSAKIFFGNFQVLTSFFSFKVNLPALLLATIRYLYSIGILLSFDLFSWPGMGCMVQVDTETRIYARTLFPLGIFFSLMLPALFSWLRVRRLSKECDVILKKKLTKSLNDTKDLCWNNVLTW